MDRIDYINQLNHKIGHCSVLLVDLTNEFTKFCVKMRLQTKDKRYVVGFL